MAQSDIEAFARSADSPRRSAQGSLGGRAVERPVCADAREPISCKLIGALEELQIAEEELHAQNVALMEAHEALECEQRRYRVLFDAAPRPFVVTDLGGSIQLVNRAAAALLEATPEVLVGTPLAMYVAPSDRQRFRERLNVAARAADSLPPLALPVALTPRRGGAITGIATVTRTLEARGGGTLMWMLPDASGGPAVADANREAMSELRRVNEELRDANRETLALLHREQRLRRTVERAQCAKAHFFTVLSHELRTPVQAILGYTELLARDLDGAMTAARQEYLRRMQQSEDHLLGLVNSVLDYERGSRGTGMIVNATAVPVREVLEAAEVTVSALAADKEQVLRIACADPSLVASGDRAMVQQILVNLVHNAIKFTPRRGRIAVDADRRGDGAIAITVRDTGRGIPREKLEHIFDPFMQEAEDDLSHGSGLGLAISRNLARTLGGELVVESDPGTGACFTLTLLAAEAAAAADAPLSPTG